MKVTLAVLLVALIAGTNCQFQPTVEQNRCFTNFLANNPDDSRVAAVEQNCNATAIATNPELGCRSPCLNAAQAIYNDECGYDVQFGESLC